MASTSFSSSALRSADYDEDTRTLDVYFTDGRSYSYHDVPPAVYDALVNASSPGSYFNRDIRNDY